MQRKWQRIILLTVLAYEAVSCLLGGSLFIATPDGRSMDMPVEIMHGVFNDFLIPGIILLGMGILNGAAFFATKCRMRIDWFLTGLALGALVIWFIVEIAILRELVWLHFVWGLPVYLGAFMAIALVPSRYATTRQVLLICGALSSLLYFAMTFLVPLQWPTYSSASQVISELSAIDAPTRPLWVWLGIAWPLAPMHLRESLAVGGGTLSDTMHIALGGATEILYILALGFAAMALGKKFRFYSITTLAAIVVFGALTFIDSSGIAANRPTPFIGIWERINIGLFLLWVVVLATMLWQRPKDESQHPH